MEHETVGSEWHLKSVIPKCKWNIMHSGKLQVRRSSRKHMLLHVLQVISSLVPIINRFQQHGIILYYDAHSMLYINGFKI